MGRTPRQLRHVELQVSTSLELRGQRPKRDIVGLYKEAARERNMRFGVSEHLSNSFDWLAPAHLSDSKGPLAGVPYDGVNPAYADLYHSYTEMPPDFAQTAKAMGRVCA